MSLKSKKILVTGAEGFIGSHLTETLVKRGHKVRAFVWYNSFNSWGWLDSIDPALKASLDIVLGDIRDPALVENAMRGCGTVFHLAALIGIPYSYSAAHSYIETNIQGTLNVLQAALKLDTERVVHTSTSEVYGTAKRVPIDEEHPLQAQSPYAASKIGADQLCMSFHRSFNLPLTIVRPFNAFGPRQSARAIIPTIISQIAAGKEELNLGALHPTRDFTYVSDTVEAFIKSAESRETVGEVLNVGSGFEISIKNLAVLIAKLMDRKVIIKQKKDRLRPERSEVTRLLADINKIKKMTKWNPVFHGKKNFEAALLKTINWFTQPENLKCYKTNKHII